MLNLATDTAVAAFHEKGLVYRSTDLLAHQFLTLLAEDGIDLREIARSYPQLPLKHENLATARMADAMAALGCTTGDTDDDRMLQGEAWTRAHRRVVVYLSGAGLPVTAGAFASRLLGRPVVPHLQQVKG